MRRSFLLCLTIFAAPCWAELWQISPGPDAEEQLQEALIIAEPGDEVRLNAGNYSITNQLSIDVDNLTLSGAGMHHSVLSFKDQSDGSEGILVTSDGVILKDFAVEDTAGDGIKSKDVDGIAILRVRVEWTNGPDANNGAYALYPVESKNVLIDGSLAIGASDAGIYVGQSDKIIVRNSRGEYNVAGLEIENSYNADVFDNVMSNNTGGFLVFDLPDIPQQGGHNVRVFNNKSLANNTKNFAPEGNIVGIVPAGTGMLIMGNRDVEVFDNEFADNKTVHIAVASYVKETEDKNYMPHPSRFHIHNNVFRNGGTEPDTGEFGTLVKDITGTPVPDIIWDGVMSIFHYLSFGPRSENASSIHSNQHDTENHYANLDFIGWFSWFPHSLGHDMSEHDAVLEPLPAVTVAIRGMDVSDPSVWQE